MGAGLIDVCGGRWCLARRFFAGGPDLCGSPPTCLFLCTLANSERAQFGTFMFCVPLLIMRSFSRVRLRGKARRARL